MEEGKFEWRQEENKVYIKYNKGEIYFVMPSEWKLSKTHPDLLRLVEYLLFSPFYLTNIPEHKFTRNPGKKIGLAFSGGIDSTAAMLLLPEETELVYHQREGFPDTCMSQDNPLYMFKNMKRKVWVIKSNQEKISEREGNKRGFSTDYCVGIGVVLMADMLGLGYFSTGQMMESTFIRGGYKAREFEKTKFWFEWSEMFKKAGLELVNPTFPCSEILTNKIVDQSEYKDLAQSCVRGSEGNGCGKCYKCFRKGMILGKPLKNMSMEIKYTLKKRPLKQAASLIYAMNKLKLDIPEISEYSEMKLDFLERYYPPALNLIPDTFRSYIKNKLQCFGVEPMTKEEQKEMMEFNISG